MHKISNFNPEFLTADYLVTTPLFLGGADHQAENLRAQSFKGVLQFWWRALAFSDFVQKHEGDYRKALGDLHQREKKIFGSAENQAAFSVQIGWIGQQPEVKKKDRPIVEAFNRQTTHGKAGIVYFARGLADSKSGNLERSCFLPGGRIRVKISFRKDYKADEDLILEMCKALKVMGLLGGLGSRNRRGFGSLSLLDLGNFPLSSREYLSTVPETVQQYCETLASLLPESGSTGKEWPLSAFARDTDIRVLEKPFQNAAAALEKASESLQLYRSWGFRDENGSYNLPFDGTGAKGEKEKPDKNFKADHDWFKKTQSQTWEDRKPSASANGVHEHDIPLRGVFGLPHNYGPKGKNVDVTPEDSERRASPLHFHIHEIAGRFYVVATHFPTQFLPDNKIKFNKGPAKVYRPNHRVITNFLDGRRPTGSQEPYFGPNIKVPGA